MEILRDFEANRKLDGIFTETLSRHGRFFQYRRHFVYPALYAFIDEGARNFLDFT